MEINDLKYFLAVTETGNINRAAENLLVSPGTLSKAIAKLELELETRLFERVGRSIRITERGRFLQSRASQIVNLEESARTELAGERGTVTVKVCGDETLLAEYGPLLSKNILALYPRAVFDFTTATNDRALEMISFGDAHLALTTKVPDGKLNSKALGNASSKTCVGRKHPLYKYARDEKAVPISEILKFAFVLPQAGFLGRTLKNQSVDGWRDDKFPRKIGFTTGSIKTLEALIVQGLAVAYLPKYVLASLDARELKVSGCPYSCEQTVYLACRNHKELGWLTQIW